MTPIGLVNNGVHVTGPHGAPSIFTHGPVQVLRLPSQGARAHGAWQLPPPRAMIAAPPPPAAGLTAHEKIFGGKQERSWSETTTQELARLEIVTMRQLQRALQQKITQSTRSPAGLWNAFHKLDRRGAQHLNLEDLIAAVRGFNLVASDELVCVQRANATDPPLRQGRCERHGVSSSGPRELDSHLRSSSCFTRSTATMMASCVCQSLSLGCSLTTSYSCRLSHPTTSRAAGTFATSSFTTPSTMWPISAPSTHLRRIQDIERRLAATLVLAWFSSRGCPPLLPARRWPAGRP